VNRGKEKGRSGMLRNTRNADVRQQKGHNVEAAF
jgi:hypothetical protein